MVEDVLEERTVQLAIPNVQVPPLKFNGSRTRRQNFEEALANDLNFGSAGQLRFSCVVGSDNALGIEPDHSKRQFVKLGVA